MSMLNQRYAMVPACWTGRERWRAENCKIWQRNQEIKPLVGQIFIAQVHWLCAHFDDDTAMQLRAVSKPLQTIITEHRDQKARLLHAWLYRDYSKLNLKTSPELPTFFVYQDDSIHTCSGNNKYYIRSQALVGPSGNTLYGWNCNHNMKRHQPVSIPINKDGTLDGAHVQYISEPIVLQGHQVFYIYGDSSYTRSVGFVFVPYELDNKDTQAVDRIIVHGAAKKMHIVKEPQSISRDRNVTFTESTVSIHKGHGTIDLPKNEPYWQLIIKNGGFCADYYEHVVAPVAKDGLPLSLALFNALPVLRDYLQRCPTTITEPFVAEREPHYPIHTVTHCYIPTAEWPIEVFEVAVDMLTRLSSDRALAIRLISKELSFSTVCRYLQLVSLMNNKELLIDLWNVLLVRSAVGKSEKSRLCFDAYNRAYYTCSDQALCKPSHQNYFNEETVCYHNSLKSLSADDVDIIHIDLTVYPEVQKEISEHSLDSPGAYSQYQLKHRKALLDASGDEMMRFLKKIARGHAQWSWDNGILGVTWRFEEGNGMRIRVYNLEGWEKHVGTYLIPENRLKNGIKSCITHVEYSTDQEPIFWIDGERVH